MTRINCHSAYKHYEMFHSRSCNSGNYGSIFNTTYNVSCGGHGGFWSGVGYGFGNVLGNMFGGMFGNMFGGMGLGNMFGGMGFGNMFGGFGFPSFGGFSGIWGGGNNSGACNCGNNSKTNIDNSKFANLTGKINELSEKVSPDANEFLNLYKEILNAKKLSDDVQKSDDNKVYDNLLNNVKIAAKKHGYEIIDGKDGKEPTIVDNNTQGVQDEPAPTSPAQEDPVDGSVPSDNSDATQASVNGDKIQNSTSLEELVSIPYEQLSEEEKSKYKEKCIELAKSTTPSNLQSLIKRLPDEVRKAVKEGFYKDGYKNVNPSDITEVLLKNLKTIIDDTAEIADFDDITVLNPTKSNDNLWTIPIKSNKSSASVQYVQVSVDPVDGEIIFHGQQENQEYVLQQDTNGKLHLMQYKYHVGYGIADVH